MIEAMRNILVMWVGFILVCGTVGLAVQPAPSAPSAPSSQTPGLATPAAGTEPSAAESAFVKRLEAVDAAMAKVVDLRADFEQRRHTALLKKPLVSKGVVLTKAAAGGNASEGRVRWDTAEPRASSMVIGDGEIRMYYPADKLVEVYPVGEGFKDLAGAPLPRLSVLRERFEIAAIGAKEMGVASVSANEVAVLLTPKSAELRKHVASVKVLIDESRPAATKVVMTDPEGEETEILFSNIRLNAGVRDEEVVLKLPDGVRVSRPLGEGKGAKENEPAKSVPASPSVAPEKTS